MSAALSHRAAQEVIGGREQALRQVAQIVGGGLALRPDRGETRSAPGRASRAVRHRRRGTTSGHCRRIARTHPDRPGRRPRGALPASWPPGRSSPATRDSPRSSQTGSSMLRTTPCRSRSDRAPCAPTRGRARDTDRRAARSPSRRRSPDSCPRKSEGARSSPRTARRHRSRASASRSPDPLQNTSMRGSIPPPRRAKYGSSPRPQ